MLWQGPEGDPFVAGLEGRALGIVEDHSSSRGMSHLALLMRNF